MKRVKQYLGGILIAGGFIFFLVHNFLVKSSEGVTRDLMGFRIPHPPKFIEWLCFIPYLGSAVMFFFEQCSWHGLVGLTIFYGLILVGTSLTGITGKK